jgi:transcription antitermination factor NusG
MIIELRKKDIPMQWFALIVKRRREKAVTESLRDRDIEAFLPVTHMRRCWSDRMKVMDVPLFPGYVFCRCSYTSRGAVLCTPGVASFVSFGGGPAEVAAEEIDGVRTIVDSGLPACDGPFVRIGQWVRIVAGPLAGLQGILSREKDALRVVVNVEILQRSVSVDVERSMTSAVRPDCRDHSIVQSLIA